MSELKLPQTPAEIRLVQREIAEAIGVSTGQAKSEWDKLSEQQQAEVFQLCDNVTMPGRTRIKRIVIETANSLAMREGKQRRAEAITKQLGEIAEALESELITADDVKKAISDCLENRKTPEQCQADWEAKIEAEDQAEKDRQAEEERKRLAAEAQEEKRKRLAAEVAEQERKAEEERKRLAAEKAEQDRKEAEGNSQTAELVSSGTTELTDSGSRQQPLAEGQGDGQDANRTAPLMTAGQLAKALGLDGAADVGQLVADGMPETRDGNKRRYDLAVCQAWIEAQDDAQEKSAAADKGGQPGDQL